MSFTCSVGESHFIEQAVGIIWHCVSPTQWNKECHDIWSVLLPPWLQQNSIITGANLVIYLNIGLSVTVSVILGAILHSVCYTDAVYSNNFERIYRSFPESINNLEIS